jgi:uncharacterized phage infection (PIP) family protein YhgE
MGRLRATSIILAPLLAALALAACGSGSDAKLLPGTTASEINQNLEAVRERVGEGNCEGAEEAAAAVSTQVDELGNGVDKKLRGALAQGAERLGEVVESCGEGEEAAEQQEAEQQEELEETEDEEEQANIEAEEKAQEKDEKAQEKEEKAQGREEEKQQSEEEGAEVPPGKAEGPKGQEEGTIEPAEPPTETPAEQGESGGIGPGEGVE